MDHEKYVEYIQLMSQPYQSTNGRIYPNVIVYQFMTAMEINDPETKKINQVFDRYLEEALKFGPENTKLIIIESIKTSLEYSSNKRSIEIVLVRLVQYLPYIQDNVTCILDVFQRIFETKSTDIAMSAVDILKSIIRKPLITEEQLNRHVLPFIYRLKGHSDLFAVYEKTNCHYAKSRLTFVFKKLLKHEHDSIRESAVVELLNWSQQLPIIEILRENLRALTVGFFSDSYEPIRIASIKISVHMALNYVSFREESLENLFRFSTEGSLGVRKHLTRHLSQLTILTNNPYWLLALHEPAFRINGDDPQLQVLRIAADNLIGFCNSLRSLFFDSDVFKQMFQEKIVPRIRILMSSLNTDAARYLLRFCWIPDQDLYADQIIPLIEEAFQSPSGAEFKKALIDAFAELTGHVNWNEARLNNIFNLIDRLIETSDYAIRCRTILAIFYVGQSLRPTKQDIDKPRLFNNGLYQCYLKLLTDPIDNIRHMSTILFPIFVRIYGACNSIKYLFPLIETTLNAKFYSYKITAVYLLFELMYPTVRLMTTVAGEESTRVYLGAFESHPHLTEEDYDTYSNKLMRILRLYRLLQARMSVKRVNVEINEPELIIPRNILELEIIGRIKQDFKEDIFGIEIDDDLSYLELVLMVAIQAAIVIAEQFLEKHSAITSDNKGKSLLYNLQIFVNLLTAEINESSKIYEVVRNVPYVDSVSISEEIDTLLETPLLHVEDVFCTWPVETP